MKTISMLAIALCLLAGCSNRPEDLKSPCVGAEGSPCDPRPVNDWWMKV
jgi:hypothetical protein